MPYPTKVIDLSLRHNDHCKRLKDPFGESLFHLESWLPFSEAVKLDRGNANVRPASERKKPFKDMMETVQRDPEKFHVKNRGIIYRCDRFEFDNSSRTIRVTIPDIPEDEIDELENGYPKFGIADGGHTFEVIRQTVAQSDELTGTHGWHEPFVRVHFLSGDEIGELEQVVEALNTSSQVQQFTMDEYQRKFDELKVALETSGFDVSLVAFRENEEKEWDIREVVQRMACFLKDRWKLTQPANMYKSKGKALELFTNEATREEFRKLYGVVRDIITLPEYIQSEFSRGEAVKGRKFGKMTGVKARKTGTRRPGTEYITEHEMDLAASLPMAAAFRELLELRGDRYHWKVDYKVVFKAAAEELYKTLLNKVRTAKVINHLGADTEYWTQTANIVLRAKDEILQSQGNSLLPSNLALEEAHVHSQETPISKRQRLTSEEKAIKALMKIGLTESEARTSIELGRPR